jgi:hypothetical protein
VNPMNPDILSELTLARLVLAPPGKGETASAVGRDLWPLVEDKWTKPGLARDLEARASGLVAKGLAIRLGKARYALTELGAEAALSLLGVNGVPRGMKWEQVKSKILTAKALGLMPPSAKVQTHVSTADGLRACILRREHRLPTGDLPTPTQVLDLLAGKAVGARKSGSTELRHALLRGWAEPFLSDLILTRLALVDGTQGETVSAVGKDLWPLMEGRMTKAELTRALEEKARDLTDKELVIRLVGKARLVVTESGAAAALGFLNVAALPKGMRWEQVKGRFLTAQALGLTPSSAKAQAHVSKSDGLRACLLKQGYKLPTGDLPTPTQVLDLLAGKAVGARKSGSTEMRHALLRQWVAERMAHVADTAGLQGKPDSNEDVPESDFAARVLAAARSSDTGWFGDNKVFISHVWRRLKQAGWPDAADEQEFKRRLLEANQALRLRLSRADLVEAMNPADVAGSATHHLGETFHFIRTD